MKFIAVVLTSILIAGCGSLTSLEELEKQAFLTGDWSAVEKRERIIEQRRARQGIKCPPGLVAICDNSAAGQRCACAARDVMLSIIVGH